MASTVPKDPHKVSRDEAKAIIEDIRRDVLGINPCYKLELQKTEQCFQDHYRQMSEQKNRRLEKDSEIALQHDAAYEGNDIPSLIFRLRAKEILIESNERGFTQADVVSICSVGESSKKDNHQTTGDEGIGFKSVFSVANKAHIQSNNWSFRFWYQLDIRNASAIATPEWTEPSTEPLPSGYTTRIRLSLERCDPEDLGELINVFDELPTTLLFALRAVRKIEIIYEDVLGRNEQQTLFLVQADFILAPDRNAILKNRWNNALRDGIVQCFVSAVEKFTEPADPLSHKWVSFLPVSSAELFWESFHEDIHKQLACLRILYTKGGKKKSLRCVMDLPPEMMFENEPILPDLADDDGDDDEFRYLSPHYTREHVKRLKILGVQTISPVEVFRRLLLVLWNKTPNSLHKKCLADGWHTAMIGILQYLIDLGWGSGVLNKKIIPLITRLDYPATVEWVLPEGTGGDITYLPRAIDGPHFKVDIPDSFDLQRLHPECYTIDKRRLFYESLGIGTCPEPVLRKAALDAEVSAIRPDRSKIQLLNSKYYFGWTLPSTKLFFRTDKEYDVQDLLGEVPIDAVPGTYGFLHQSYTENPAESIPSRHGQTWHSWLNECSGVCSFPTLLDSSNKLHPILQKTAETNSVKFLGCLHKYWEGSYQLEEVSEVETTLKELLVICRNGTKQCLSTTILPTTTLLSRSEGLDLSSTLPFLKLPVEIDPEMEDSWRFLECFGVTVDVNLDYHFSALAATKDELEKRSKEGADCLAWGLRTCSKIYRDIADVVTQKESSILRAKFSKMKGIFIPWKVNPWCAPEDLFWSGESITLKPVLREIYNHGDANARRLFVEIVGVCEPSYGDVLLEIEEIKCNGSPSVELLSVHYRTLSDLGKDLATKELIRHEFTEHGYIYAPGNRWLLTSETIWQGTADLTGRTTIGPWYPDLEDFFRKDIGVVTQDVVMLLGKIASAAERIERNSKSSTDASFDLETFKRLRELLIVTGQVIQVTTRDEEVKDCLNKLKACCFLPCTRGKFKSLNKPGSAFFIADNKRYATLFSGQLRFLDFDDAEMTFVYPLLDALDLLGASLSQHVTVVINANVAKGRSLTHLELTSYLRHRAYAISCCAVIFEGRPITVNSARPSLMVEEAEEGIEIFVPSVLADIHTCFRTDLPPELAKVLRIENPEAKKQLYRIINDVPNALERIMAEEDLAPATWLENTCRFNVGSATGARVPNNSHRASTEKSCDSVYQRFLERLIRHAREASGGCSPASATQWSFENDNDSIRDFLGLRHEKTVKKDKINAAGELYVFERLRALNLAGFSTTNWVSRIRDRVNVVPEYNGLGLGTSEKEADLFYEASSGDFEAFLRQYSKLMPFPPNWGEFHLFRDQTVTYLILVDATTERFCSTQFRVTEEQYKKMREHRSIFGLRPHVVYVVCRVYNLLGTVGLDVALDPLGPLVNGVTLNITSIKARLAEI
ncbi:hypothetical protein LTR84_004081 [Exophiala bonariae]|uniref:Sacsin/Nov domain-containing protein n=1 Tax=Exophiala bonariae TaxID=1690606 RepID=A0AAV9N5A9_9EURO|nr:hypothetical protein LTR84_004081 [Exophiala bonariae]